MKNKTDLHKHLHKKKTKKTKINKKILNLH